jgi:hypothetical protein
MQLHEDDVRSVSVVADAIFRNRRANAGRKVGKGNDHAVFVKHVTDV